MSKITMNGKGSVTDISNIISNGVLNSGLSCELVESVQRTSGSFTMYVTVFEKYYMRASNRASLTVIVTGIDDDICVDAIGSGGGQGAIFSFSWGAEEDFAGTVKKILKKNGFK